MTQANYRIGTKCVQSGWKPKNGDPRIVPITQSTTFAYDSAEQLGRLFDLEESGYFYSRLANPTCDAVAEKIASLEGGVGAVLTASGQAASLYAILNIAQAGDHIVSAATIYGGTLNLFAVTMKRLGIDFTFVEPDAEPSVLEAAFRPNTKAVFGETIANPALRVLDIAKFAEAAHRHGVPLIIDNTFPTPIHCRPLEWGADIVIHSTTKYMDGHATSVGGVVVDGGRFDWRAQGSRFAGLTEPDDSYHGLVFVDAFGPAAYYGKMVATLQRDLGACPSAFNAFLLNVGLETLHLRMARHAENALAAASMLERHKAVEWVIYPGLPGSKDAQLVQKYLPNGTCGVISFGLKGGREAAVRFMENAKLARIVTHVADARTCVLHPASTTHRQLSDEQLEAAGVAPEMVRLSVGIEDIADIHGDLDQALKV